MARLIPSFVDDKTPPGERDVFNLLAAGPADWVAIHSLDLAPWNKSQRTEIDFVVIVPDAGILCVEVKSYESITFDGEKWLPEKLKRSPFKQACDGRYALYRRLSEWAHEFRRVPVVHCCIFPRAPFDLRPNLSVRPWELMDSRSFRSFTSGEAFCADLKDRIFRSISDDPQLRTIDRPLPRKLINELVQYSLPIQKRRPDKREEIRAHEEQLEKILLEQQRAVLRLVELNSRVIVSGAAGTGKTLTALEVAKRAADKGLRVALLCYNQLVGDWMTRRVEEQGYSLPNLIVGRAIRVMARITEIDIPENPSQEFWDSDLPQMLEDRLTDPTMGAIAGFDYLVLDEAQDIFARPRLWNCLMQFLGGPSSGAFAIFGDFENQVLAERNAMHDAVRAVEETHPVRWHFHENCRNYRIVADTAVRLAGLKVPVYSNYLRGGGSVSNYDIFFYRDDQAQLDKLATLIKEFKSLGYKASEITVLSFRADHLSAAAKLKATGHKLRRAWQQGESTAYATVHAFKGLESKIVILTDVVLMDRELHRDLFYTGMTRATEYVRVLCEEKSQDILVGWLSEASQA